MAHLTGHDTGGYGVDLLSEKIPIKPNTRYRCTGVTRSDGPNMKVFVRGYGTVTRRVKGELKTFEDAVYTMRKDIPPTGDWTPFNLDFTIVPFNEFGAHQHRVEYVRIKLWAYWPAGTCWFDNLRFEEVGPLPALELFADFMDELGAGGAVFSEDPEGGDMVTVFLPGPSADGSGRSRRRAGPAAPASPSSPCPGERRTRG